MTVKECYDKFNGDYNDAVGRFSMDSLIEKFMLKFLNDPTMSSLKAAVEAGSIEDAFRAAHTLKGVAANLSFAELQNISSELTEQLRPCDKPADMELYAKVCNSYELIIKTIEEYVAQKA